MRAALHPADVERLLNERSPEVRAETAAKVASAYTTDDLTESERALARSIIERLVSDVSVRVRASLAENIKHCPDIPHAVARSLAEDVEQVALPMLEFSRVLNDDDLIALVRSRGPALQGAIARRASVSEDVAEVLIDVGVEDVVVALVGNSGARLSEPQLDRSLARFGNSPRVADAMAGREALPVRVALKLMSAVSDHLREHLIVHHGVPRAAANVVIEHSRERATLGLVRVGASQDEVRLLIAELDATERLTPSIILRAMCLGDTLFFEMALARRANIPLINAQILIHDENAHGLIALWQRAGMPDDMLVLARAAVDVGHETGFDGGPNDEARFRRRMMQRVLTVFDDPDRRFAGDDLDYLLAALSRIDPGLASVI